MAKKKDSLSFKEIDTSQELKQMGARIREIRRSKGYTSYETFANEHDIHRVQWGRYEQGEDLYFSTLLRVIKVLDISVEEFFAKGFNKK